jgi:nucleotide-binding universal stress UspA family protein
MADVYENVIVPFDGSVQGRAALAPASDLAWRCGARVVIVNNTDASDKASREAIKTRAMNLSGADVDFWVDLKDPLGTALLEAAKYRPNPVICVSAKQKQGGLLRGKRPSLPAVADEVVRRSPVPVLVIGQETDVSRGLPMTELVVSTDGSEQSQQVLPLAASWARGLKLKLTLIGVVHEGAENTDGEREYLEGLVTQLSGQVPEVGYELVRAPDPAAGIVRFMDAHDDAIIAMATHGRGGTGKGTLGGVAARVVARSKRATLLVRPS